jgi:hypothetical protein
MSEGYLNKYKGNANPNFPTYNVDNLVAVGQQY